MFKEALVGVLALSFFYVAYRFLWRHRRRVAVMVFVAILVVFCAANVLYNGFVMFPDFYMDTVSGVFRYGTFSGNLFAYSDQFMFRDNILFPILENRAVSLDDTAGFYKKFFSLYAREYDEFDIPENARQEIASRQADFDFSYEFSCIGIMDYVKDEIPQALIPSFDEEIYPLLHINTASLKGQERLIVLMEPDYTLYVMGEAYYKEITGDAEHE